jgi:hypothetical protein
MNHRELCFVVVCLFILTVPALFAQAPLPLVDKVDLQPLQANCERLLQALEFLGAPLPAETAKPLKDLLASKDAKAVEPIQQLLDPHCLIGVTINPESRVKAARGMAAAELVQGGWTVRLIKVQNDGGVTAGLRVGGPHIGSVVNVPPAVGEKRWLDAQVYTNRPMTDHLSGAALEYLILVLSSRDAGRREATLQFDVGQGTQDLGFRAEVPILFDVKPGVPVPVRILDETGQPTIASLMIRDGQGRVYPSRFKRLAPDFFFHDQIYRATGETVLLAPGQYQVTIGRGPEYQPQTRELVVARDQSSEIAGPLERWVNPRASGWYSGDHHIHAAGCQHYTNPSEGVLPEDMFRHVKGEALNVGCVLTWGPCYEYQKRFFEGKTHKLSDPLTLMRYDVEVSGFGSQRMGHVCLLRLHDQDYPGSGGDKEKWPSWCTPILRWAKAQKAVTGFAHSALGYETAISEVPSYRVPHCRGIGANELFVNVTEGLCDFISAMNTNRYDELNSFYHVLNCGFPLKLSGETDFPCVSGSRVGMGRVYVKLAGPLNFDDWAEGIRLGRSYVSDGYAHPLEFRVGGQEQGFDPVKLDKTGEVPVRFTVACAPSLGRAQKVEVVVNAKPVYAVEVPADGRPHTFETAIPVERSSWVALRQFPRFHTNPVNVLVANQPIRADRRSAEWCIQVIDQVWSVKQNGIKAEEQADAKAAFERAKAVYAKIAKECP